MNTKGRSGLTIGLVAVAGVVLVGAIWFISARNSLIQLDEATNGAWSEIDNQLQRRSDLIPNLVETVKGFAKQELEVFGEIADARARMAGAGSVAEKAAGYNELQSALSRLLVVVENYPDLKSNRNFIALQDELAGTENRIAVARKRYNDSVRRINTKIRQFPGSIVASRAGLEQREYFEIEESAREAPKVSF
jgi:LemA protein